MRKKRRNIEEEARECDIRLETLKQATIENYLTEIDSNNDLYEVLINKLVEGKLDNWFYAPELNHLDGEKRREVFELARDFASLCFFQGDVNQWLESVEGVSLEDMGYTCMKILDNYNFLLNLANQGGLEALKEVERFGTSNYLNGPEIYGTDVPSIIEKLRNNFADDELLISILRKMTFDPAYQDLSTDEKVILCSYPEGNLYTFSEDDNIIFLNPEKIKKNLAIEKLLEEKTEELIKTDKEDKEITAKDLTEEEIKTAEDNISPESFDIYVTNNFYEYITSHGFRNETASNFYR